MTNELVPIKAYGEKEMRDFYDVTNKTWRSWCKPFISEIGELHGKTYTPKQVSLIFDKLGHPEKK